MHPRRRIVAGASCSVLAMLLLAGRAAPAPEPSVYVTPTGSDDAACTWDAPCQTLERAYRAVPAGGVIELGEGAYEGLQRVRADSVKARGERIVVRSAPGTVATIAGLDVFASNIEFRDIAITGAFYVKCGADRVTFRRVRAGIFFIRSASRIAILDSELGPWINKPSTIGPGDRCTTPPREIRIERSFFHDYRTEPHNATHDECLLVPAVVGLVIRSTRFHRCEDFDILLKRYGTDIDISNVTLENNWFGEPYPDGASSVQFSAPEGGASFTNVLIRNNSFAGGLVLKPEISYANVRVFGNAGVRYGGPCTRRGIRVAYNVWGRGPCRGPNTIADPGFRDPVGLDLHLVPGAAAIDRGHPKSFAAFDIDGERRPIGRRADAGADEVSRGN